jgi:hypothetical protein
LTHHKKTQPNLPPTHKVTKGVDPRKKAQTLASKNFLGQLPKEMTVNDTIVENLSANLQKQNEAQTP